MPVRVLSLCVHSYRVRVCACLLAFAHGSLQACHGVLEYDANLPVLHFQVAGAVCVPALACLALWACLRPPEPSLKFAAAIAAVFAAGIVACRAFLLELQYQARPCHTNPAHERAKALSFIVQALH